MKALFFLAVLMIVACESKKPSTTSKPFNDFDKVVGRWGQVALVINGNDVPHGAVTQAGPVRYYIFKSDSTFQIIMNDSTREEGRWSINPNVSPKIFDHTDHLKDAPYIVPGIYEITDDLFKICIWDPKHGKEHPTGFESKAENGSWIVILKRVGDAVQAQ
jgi:uncharacterized protein (TIGR03067 family)